MTAGPRTRLPDQVLTKFGWSIKPKPKAKTKMCNLQKQEYADCTDPANAPKT